MRSALVGLLAWLALPGPPVDPGLERWRREREAELRAEHGWLSVVGLHWLADGRHAFGSDPAGAIVLPAGSAPGRAGVLELGGGRALVKLEPGLGATLAGRAVQETELRPDGEPLALGTLALQLIRRGERLGLRVRDANAPARRRFGGLRWYPARPEYRVSARWEAAPPGHTLPIPNVLGDVSAMPSPGTAVFALGGRDLRLSPVLERPDSPRLFFIFRDATSGRETYGGGRFLYTPRPEGGRLVLDFNRAESPPCAFTAYATCPLPPRQNRLAVAIEAGERDPGVLTH